MTTAAPSTALATIQPVFTDAERLALAGFLAGYRGLTREAYALDLRQFTTWCRARSLPLFAVRRADIESFARDLEALGRACAAGGSHDTVTGNTIENQAAWGIVTSDNPDSEQPSPAAHCQGGIDNDPLPGVCLFQARGNQIYRNVLSHDEFFANPANSDLATETLASCTPRNCFYNNADHSGPLTSAPAGIQSARADGQPCGQPGTGIDPMLALQLACATAPASCLTILASYPQQTRTLILPLPRLPSMPRPCTGVPRNAFCP